MDEREALMKCVQDSVRANVALTELTRLRRLNFWGKVILALAIIAVVFIYAGLSWSAVKYTVASEKGRKEFQQAFAEQTSTIARDITVGLRETAQKVYPDLRDAFEKEFQERMPEIRETYETEFRKFSDNIGPTLEAKITEGLEKLLKQQEKVLKRHFPELEDPEKMEKVVEGIEIAFVNSGKKVLLEELHDYIEALGAIKDTLDQYPSLPPDFSDTELLGEIYRLSRRLIGLKLQKEVAE